MASDALSVNFDISSIVKAIRKSLGLTQLQMSQAMGITQGSISKMEKGKLEPTVGQWVKMCKQLGLPLTSIDDDYLDLARTQTNNDWKKFNVPAQLSPGSGAGYHVRFLAPVLKTQAGRRMGELAGISDLDYFYDLDNCLGQKFSLGVLKQAQQGPDYQAYFGIDHFRRPSFHGKLHQRYEDAPDVKSLVQLFERSQPFYQNSFETKLKQRSDSELLLSLTPHPELKLEAPQQDLLVISSYYQSFLKGILGYKLGPHDFKLSESWIYAQNNSYPLIEYELQFS